MSQLDRYIARHVISASGLVLFVLIMLRAMFAMLQELNSIGEGSYQVADAFLYVALILPQKFLEIFPMGVLIGSLFGLGTLASNNELTVMRAAGVTTWRIAGSALKASIILMMFALLLSEIVAPVASKSAQQLRTAALSEGKITRSETGLWAKNRVLDETVLVLNKSNPSNSGQNSSAANNLGTSDSDADNQIIHIESIHKSGKMTNVSLYQIDKEFRLVKLTESSSASFINNEWFLFDVSETSFSFESFNQPARISKIHYQKLKWANPLDQDNIDTLTLKHETLNINGLMKYENYLSSNLLDSAEVELSIWQKLLMPISLAIMMFLATSFVFGPMRDVSMGARVLSGVLLGFGFNLAKQSFGPISLIYEVSPFFGAIIPLIGFAGLAVWLMRRSS